MLRIWGIWVIASTLTGVVIGLKTGARRAVLAGLAAGVLAFAFNSFQGDSLASSFWSLAAAGGGLVVGGVVGAAIMSVLGGREAGD